MNAMMKLTMVTMLVLIGVAAQATADSNNLERIAALQTQVDAAIAKGDAKAAADWSAALYLVRMDGMAAIMQPVADTAEPMVAAAMPAVVEMVRGLALDDLEEFGPVFEAILDGQQAAAKAATTLALAKAKEKEAAADEARAKRDAEYAAEQAKYEAEEAAYRAEMAAKAEAKAAANGWWK